MKYLFLGFLLNCLLSNYLIAQPFPDWNLHNPSATAYGRNKTPLSQIQGSPYLDNTFKKGTVITDEDVVFKDIPLRYNCFLDVIEFQKDDLTYELKPKNKIKRVEFGWQKYVYNEIKSLKGYFAILAEGRATLLARFTLKFFEPGPAQGFADAAPAAFDELMESFYLSMNGAPAIRISNSKKLLEVMADKKNEVKAYISEQKLSTSNAEHMKKIINYYNTLN